MLSHNTFSPRAEEKKKTKIYKYDLFVGIFKMCL